MNKRLLTLFLGIILCPVSLSAQEPKAIGVTQAYKAKYEDTFVVLARKYNLGFTELISANPYVDPWLPGEGTDLILPTMHILPESTHTGLVINLPEMRMYIYQGQKDGTPISFPVGIGREGLNTPIGTTTIVRKVDGPVWRPTPRMRKEDPKLPVSVGQGIDNPMGTHALYLGWSEYAIHGTNMPYGIGRRVSSGCIRMNPEDIPQVFGIMPEGGTVTVVNQPLKTAWIDGKFYLEAHPTQEQALEIDKEGGFPSFQVSLEDLRALQRQANFYKIDLDWQVIRKALRERRGYPIVINKA